MLGRAPAPATQRFEGASLKFELESKLADALKQQAQQQGVTLFMLLLASFQTLLNRQSGQSGISIGVPGAGRSRLETEGLIGFFINTQVLRVQVDERATFAELLEQVKDVIGGAQSHQELPFEHLVDALLPERNLAHNPLFQFKINQHVAAGDASRKRLGTLEVEGFAREGGDARFDLAFDFSDKPDGIEGYFTYATDLFEQATIQRLADSLRRVLDVLSDQAGVQVYSGNFLDGSLQGASGRPYHAHAAICIEPQAYPDAMNQPALPDITLQPGAVYRNRIRYRFSKDTP